MVSIKQLRAFVAVANAQSFAEACSMVHLSQPALSIAIKNLEEAIGGALLVRTTRTLSLTPEGEVFLPTAQRLLTDWDAALEDIHNRFALRRGKVAIAAMPSFASNLLPKILLQFHRAFPDINVSVEDVVAEEVISKVRQGRVELGVSFDPGEEADLLFTPLFQDRFVALVSPEYPLVEQGPIRWEQLAQHNFIALQRPSSIRLMIDHTLTSVGAIANVNFESHQLATIGRMVAAGLGVSAVPSLCQSQMEEMGCVCLELIQPEVDRRVGILTRRRYPLSVAAQTLKESLEAYWSNR